MRVANSLEFTHFLASTDQALAKAAEFNSDRCGSRYRSAGLNRFARPTDFHRSEKKRGLPDPFSCTIQGAKNKRKEKATL